MFVAIMKHVSISTLKLNLFELLCAIDVKLVSSHSLECQLSVDTLLIMFIVYITGVIVR